MKRLSIKKLFQMFPTENDCISFYIQYRYKDNKPICRHCGSTHVYQYHNRPKFFKCADCNNTFSIFKNTIFEKTHLDFRVWFYAIQFLLNSKKGISAYQLTRYWDMTYKTAWRTLKQIRLTFEDQGYFDDGFGVYMADEVYANAGVRQNCIKDLKRYSKAVKAAPMDDYAKAILDYLKTFQNQKKIII